jgi:hypothetical protein
VAAHVLDLELELRLAALGGSLEGQVLEEVCGTIGLVGLGARTSVDPDTDGAGLGVGRVLGRNLLEERSADCAAAEELRINGMDVR